MIFNNRENECVTLQDGRKVWLSRACAVVASVYIKNVDDGNWYVAMVKRGEGMPDEVGKWVMPCGYLDWNESLSDASKREVYEETGLNVDVIRDKLDYKYCDDYVEEQPSLVASNPQGDAKENISHHFVLAGEFTKLPEFDMSLIDPKGECSDIKWIKFTELAFMDEDNQIAFGHYERILEFTERYELD